jgi:hypothetical protein
LGGLPARNLKGYWAIAAARHLQAIPMSNVRHRSLEFVYVGWKVDSNQIFFWAKLFQLKNFDAIASSL